MIFDENYDKTLWLLVASNKKDRDKICNFIKYIPEDIYLKIQKSINDYYNGDLNNVRENVIYKDTFICIDEYSCFIIVRIKNGRLYINLNRWKEDIDRIEEEYNLVLRDMFNDELDEMLLFDNGIIGKYYSEINNIKFLSCLTDVETDIYDRKYYIKKYPIGYIVFSRFGKKIVNRKFVNVSKNMPDEVFMTDFSNKDMVNALVKKRIRDKKTIKNIK